MSEAWGPWTDAHSEAAAQRLRELPGEYKKRPSRPRIWVNLASWAFGLAAIVGSLGWSYADAASRQEEWQRIAEMKAQIALAKQAQVDKLRDIVTMYLGRAEAIKNEPDSPGDAIIAARIAGDIIEHGFAGDDELLEEHDMTRTDLSVTLLQFIWPEGMPGDVIIALREKERQNVGP